MSRAALVVLLCIIVVAPACARRQARAVTVPRATAAAQTSPRTSESAGKMRDAIRSLKDRLDSESGTPGRRSTPEREVSGTSGQGSPAGEVGTTGAVTVETRYPTPSPQAGAAGAAPTPPGRVLSRAARAARQATDGSWLGIVALCALAAAAVAVAILRRRSAT